MMMPGDQPPRRGGQVTVSDCPARNVQAQLQFRGKLLPSETAGLRLAIMSRPRS